MEKTGTEIASLCGDGWSVENRSQHLDNLKPDITDVSEEEQDMSKRLKQRVTLAGKPQWVTGESMQELFDAYLQRAIDLGIVILANNETKNTLPAADVLFEKRAWQWFNLYKVGKIRLNTLANYELYLKKHIIPHFGQRDIRTITIDDVQEFMNSKAMMIGQSNDGKQPAGE